MEEHRILKKIIRGNEHALEAAIAQYRGRQVLRDALCQGGNESCV